MILNNKDEQNKQILKIKDFVEENIQPTIDAATDDGLISSLKNSLSTKINLFKVSIQRQIDNLKDFFKNKLLNIYDKTKYNSLYLDRANIGKYVDIHKKWIAQAKQVFKNRAGIHVLDRTDDIMYMNGVSFKIEGNKIRFINPDGTEMYAYDSDTETHFVNKKALISLDKKIVSAGKWKLVNATPPSNEGESMDLPENFNDLMIVYHANVYNHNWYPNVIRYEQISRVELPIKFYLPYGRMSLEITENKLKLVKKRFKLYVPAWGQWNDPIQGPCHITKVFYR